MQEIMAVAALPEHPNIVGHYRAWQQEGHFYIQMDLCEGGNLDTISAAVRVLVVLLMRGFVCVVGRV